MSLVSNIRNRQRFVNILSNLHINDNTKKAANIRGKPDDLKPKIDTLNDQGISAFMNP